MFDSRLWAGKDVGDNSQFYKPATIRALYKEQKDWFADVLFHYDGFISRGHFVTGIRFLEQIQERSGADDDDS